MCGVLLLFHRVGETLPNASGSFVSYGFDQCVGLAAVQREVRSLNRRVEFCARGLESGVGRAFTFPMNSNQFLEEKLVGQFERLLTL